MRAVRDYRQPILDVLSDGQEWKTEDLAEAVYQEMGHFDPDDYEMMSVESGTPHERRYKNLNAAKTQLYKEGLIEQVRHGYWRIKR